MENTTNYDLKKPGLEDSALIDDLNENADTIDGLLKQLSNAADGLAADLASAVAALQAAISAQGTNLQTQITALQRHRVTTANTDLNDYTTEGVYYFGQSYTPAHVPVGVAGTLIVLSQGAADASPNACKQLWLRDGSASGNNTHMTFERENNSGDWTNWTRFWTSADLSSTILGYLSGITSDVQTQLDNKFPRNGFTGSNISRIVVTDGQGVVRPYADGPSVAQLYAMRDLSTASTLQTQLNGKATKSHQSATGEYGLGAANAFGHLKIADNFSASAFDASDPVALSAYRGKLLNDRLNDPRTLVTTSGTDLNDYRTLGIYFFTSSYTPTNIPDGVAGTLIVLPLTNAWSNSTAVKQIWLRYGSASGNNSSDMWERMRDINGVWTDWIKYATKKDVSIGAVVTNKGGTVSVSSGDDQPFDLQGLNPGVYLIQVSMRWANNGTGYRKVWLSTTMGGGPMANLAVVSCPAVSGDYTYQNFTYIAPISEQRIIYVVAKQTSGVTLDGVLRMTVLQLKGEMV